MGIAAAIALLVGVFGGTVIAKERALRQAIDDLPAGEQSFYVDLIGLPAEDQPTADGAVQAALGQLTGAEPVRVTFFRDFLLDSEFVRLAALDRPGRYVRLVSGRLPRRCSSTACEVLQIGNRGRAALHEGGINLIRVGIGEFRDVSGLGPAFQRLRQERAQASIVESIPLLAPSTAALEHLPALQLFFRVRSWVVPLGVADLHAWDIDRTLSRESRAQEILLIELAGEVVDLERQSA